MLKPIAHVRYLTYLCINRKENECPYKQHVFP